MRSIGIALVVLLVIGVGVALSAGPGRTGSAVAAAHITAVAHGDQEGQGDEIAILDDCDPTDPTWAPTGGCALEKGDVNRAEFNALRFSPLSLSTVGHPAWRFGPSYLKTERNESVKVTNKGGRGHTFTEVADFGGGFVPPLNQGLTPAPECKTAGVLPPGASVDVTGLSAGNHRFQCCIHPWMRALIKVKPED